MGLHGGSSLHGDYGVAIGITPERTWVSIGLAKGRRGCGVGMVARAEGKMRRRESRVSDRRSMTTMSWAPKEVRQTVMCR